MIEYIHLTRFGPHEDLRLDLHPGINVFMGRSSTGKTWASLRPLRNIVFNRPLGDGYVLDPALLGKPSGPYENGPTIVEIGLIQPDGSKHKVTKLKDARDHYYRLDDNKELTFRPFGHNPPEDIRQLLNMGDLNFQTQHAPLYLLSMSAPEVGRILNELAGLDLINSTISRINGRYRRENQQAEAAEAERDRLKKELARYDTIGQADIDLQVCERLEMQSLALKAKVSSIRTMAYDLRGAGERLARYAGLDNVITTSSLASSRIFEASVLKNRSDTIRRVANKLRQSEVELARYIGVDKAKDSVQALIIREQKASRLRVKASAIRSSALNLRQAEDRINKLSGLDNLTEHIGKAIDKVKEAQGLREKARKIGLLAATIKGKEMINESINEELKNLHAEFDRLMPSVCPLCGK